ncbi:MAG: signal peptide peptidase SppA [Curvibacter sp.]|nr:signal peptide peptidase SppA [Curvibacter sp.]
MTPSPNRSPWRWLQSLLRWIDASRRITLNLLFLAALAAVLWAIVGSRPERLQDGTTLVLDLAGPVVEQDSSGLRDSLLEQTQGGARPKLVLHQLLAVLDQAAKDPHISQAVLLLDDFEGGGMASLEELGSALDRFKAGGKTVTAWASSYDQRQYSLAAHANQLLMHPMGMVYLKGFGSLRNYYLDAMDRLGVTATLVRVGTFKSAAEPFIANAPSEAAREADQALVDSLWSTYLGQVEGARHLPSGSLMAYIDEAPQRLADSGGDAAKAALSSKLVDGLKTPDELTRLLIERGSPDAQGHGYRRIRWNDYLEQLPGPGAGAAVGVIVAEGEIVDGDAAPGTIGGRSTAAQIRQAREDKDIRALVLRVNSPGGSAFGSELVRHELELTRAAGKPVVVSMGDVAASGGYWVGMAADQVIAAPGTITGSIGVFALLPSVNQAMDRLGVHAQGVATTWLGHAGDPRLPPDPRVTALLQTVINHTYADFTERAARARKMSPEQIDQVAQGRVWTGVQAKERGLIDSLGRLGDALTAAATLAKLPEGYRVRYLRPRESRLERVLAGLGAQAGRAAGQQLQTQLQPLAGALQGPLGSLGEAGLDFGWLAPLTRQGRPFTAVAHCFCSPP